MDESKRLLDLGNVLNTVLPQLYFFQTEENKEGVPP